MTEFSKTIRNTLSRFFGKKGTQAKPIELKNRTYKNTPKRITNKRTTNKRTTIRKSDV